MKCLPTAQSCAFVATSLGLLLGLISPLPAQPSLPDSPSPLGRPDLEEKRVVKQLRPGITHVHVERGEHRSAANRWGIISPKLTDKTEVAAMKARLSQAGLGPVTEHWFDYPSANDGTDHGEPPYCILHAGSFSSKLEAREAMLGLPFHEGLQVRNEASLADWDAGPWMLDIVIVDPKSYEGKGIVSARTPLRSRPSEIAQERNAVVGINAGFFEFSKDDLDGVPSGTLIIQGEWYHESNGAPTLFIENGTEGPKLFVSTEHPPLPEIKLSSGKTRAIDGINRMPQGDEITAMRPDILAHSGLSHSFPSQYLAMQPGKDGQLIPITGGGNWNPASLTLIGTGRGRAFLEEARFQRERVLIDLHIPGRPGLNGTYGAHILLKDDQPALEWWRFHERRTSRSAIGADSQGRIYIIAVDGDAFEPPADKRLGSVGANLEEMQAIFQFLGAVNAVGLDGGGSTSLAIEGKVANHPYNVQLEHGDGIERPVSDSILVLDVDGIDKQPRVPGKW